MHAIAPRALAGLAGLAALLVLGVGPVSGVIASSPAGAQADAGMESGVGTALVSDPDAGSLAGADADADADTEAGADADADADTEADVDTDADAGSGGRTRWTMESGLVAGGAVGRVEGPTHSVVRAVVDFGFLFEPRLGRSPAWGLALYGATGREDLRLGVKPRLWLRLSRNWALETSAGLLFTAIEGDSRVSATGFVGGLSFQRGATLSLRSDVQVVHVDPWQTVHVDVPRIHPGGREVALYGGVTLRNRAGWILTTAGVLTFTALLVLLVSSGATS